MRRAVAAFALLIAAILTTAGFTPAASSNSPSGTVNSVDHVVVLMQENRSADNYLGQLSSQGQPDYEKEPLTGNPDPLTPGKTILPFHKTTLCETADLSHSWDATHQEFDNGAMDGFTAANDINSENSDPADPTGSRTMGYYDQRDLPFYYSLYNTFATGDRYFASVLSQTFPNRFYLLAATSFGHIANDFPPAGGWQQKTIFDLLGAAGVSWKIYYSQFAFGSFFQYVQQHPDHVAPLSQYYEDAKNGNLPAVSFVDPNFLTAAEDDEHPPTNIDLGQQLTYNLVSALEGSPNWNSSAMFFTYDEHGGFYDHVPPPAAVKPDDIAPMLGPNDTQGAFDNYGIRVPVAVISPFAKPHFVSHVVHDHTSILKFIEDRFGLPSLTARDAAADPMMEFFDFAHPAFETAPSFSAPPVLNCDETPTSTTTTTTAPTTSTTSSTTSTTAPTSTTTIAGPATVSVDPSQAAPGENVAFSGSGFPAKTTLELEFHSTPVALGMTTTDGNGSFSISVTVPGTGPGLHQLSAATLDGKVAAVADIEVLSTSSSTSSTVASATATPVALQTPSSTAPAEVLGAQVSNTPIAFTGLNARELAALGAGLIVLGLLVGARRRIRTP